MTESGATWQSGAITPAKLRAERAAVTRQRLISLTVALCICALVIGLQWAGGAYHTGFGAHPDEAAHYVTGLMVHDYIAAGFPGHPMRYAEKYYEHYPKVALGHYPPGFYGFAAGWMLLFSPGRASTLIFLAAIASATAGLLYTCLRRELGIAVAIFGACAFLLLPLVQHYTQMVMADLLVAFFALGALTFAVRFLERERMMDAIGFGVLASVTIMVKTSGLWLAPVPVLGALLVGKPRLMRKFAFWVPALIVVLLCAPWTLLTFGVMKAGMADRFSASYTSSALTYFSTGVVRQVGVVLLLLAAAGFVKEVILPLYRRQPVAPLAAVFGAMAVCVVSFHLLVPVGLEMRYLLPTFPAFLVFACACLASLRDMIVRRSPDWGLPDGRAVGAALVVAMGVVFLAEMFRVQRKESPHFAALLPQVAAIPTSSEILVSSDASGEGAFIAEVAMNELRPGHIIRRSSKLLAKSDWMGRGYALQFATVPELVAGLETARIRSVLVDGTMPRSHRLPHHELMEAAIIANPERFLLKGSVGATYRDALPAETARLYFIALEEGMQ